MHIDCFKLSCLIFFFKKKNVSFSIFEFNNLSHNSNFLSIRCSNPPVCNRYLYRRNIRLAQRNLSYFIYQLPGEESADIPFDSTPSVRLM